MTPKEKAEDLINSYRMILMNEDTECGNEILCTSISKKNALILVNEMLNNFLSNRTTKYGRERYQYWQKVKQEIELL